jgi:DNA polymerase-3 subunit alpha
MEANIRPAQPSSDVAEQELPKSEVLEPEPAYANEPEQDELDRNSSPEPPLDSLAKVVTTGLGAVVSPAPRGAVSVPFIPPKPAPRGERQPRMVTIYLRSKGDKARDILAIRRVHGALISYPGNDRFAFYVFEGRSGYLLDFPNDTTDLNEELQVRLIEMVGENNLRVEPILFH